MFKNCLILSSLICTLANAQSIQNTNDKKIQIFQGWTQDELQDVHSLNMGSEILPLSWFQSLELNSTQTKLKDQLSSYGFIEQNDSLPIGMTTIEDLRTSKLYGESKWVGINCAACHTSQLVVNGRQFLIEGGPSIFNIQKFEKDIISSVKLTLANPNKLARFANSTNQTNLDSLKQNLSLFLKEFSDWVKLNHHFFDKNNEEVEYGPGRIDALGTAVNIFSCKLTDRMGSAFLVKFVTDSRNCRNSQPPSSIPHLWGSHQNQFTLWNGTVHDMLGRNLGAAAASFGKNWVEFDPVTKIKYQTTANIENVVRLSEYYKKLNSPSWKELVKNDIVKELDIEKTIRGKKIYVENCLNCHSIQPESTKVNSFGNSYWKVNIISAQDVGTADDYLIAESSRKSMVPTSLISIFKKSFGENSLSQDNQTQGTNFRDFAIGANIFDYFSKTNTTEEQNNKLSSCRETQLPQPILGYKARSLEGIVWTAPYLHNGSVPTLYDLLLLAKKRPKTFYIGCNSYDINKAGFNCQADSKNAFLMDITKDGNNNQGHEFGSDLTDDERFDLIEFLKSLEQPKDPFPLNSGCN